VCAISDGTVQLRQGRKKSDLETTQKITGKDILIIGKGVTLTLLDPGKCDQYVLKGAFTGTVDGYLKRNEQGCVRHISKTYFNYLYSRMINPKVYAMESEEIITTSALRKGDSILLNTASDTLIPSIDSMDVLSPDTAFMAPNDTLR
jgi:hypothetical protein